MFEPEEVEHRARRKGGAKRPPKLTLEEPEQLADKHGVSQVYTDVVEAALETFSDNYTTQSNISFWESINGSRYVILALHRVKSSATDGLSFRFYPSKAVLAFGVDEKEIWRRLPEDPNGSGWSGARHNDGFTGYVRDARPLNELIQC